MRLGEKSMFAGTSKGVYHLETGEKGKQVLASRGVRELVSLDCGLFAGTGSGLYRSTNQGQSWDLLGFEDMEIWQIRESGERIWVSTQPAGLYCSDDQGLTWTGIDTFNEAPEKARWCIPVEPVLPGRARALVIDREDPRRMLVGVEVGGIMRTEDGGATWEMVLPGDNPDLHMIFQHPTESDVVYASTGYGRLDGVAEMVEGNAGVLRSDDFGKTWAYRWQGITPRYSRPMCIDEQGITVASAPTAFSSYKEDGGAKAMVFRSEDRGESWRSLCDESHTPSAANFHGLTTDPNEPGSVYVGTDTGEVWHVSPDTSSGGKWHQVGAGLPAVLSICA